MSVAGTVVSRDEPINAAIVRLVAIDSARTIAETRSDLDGRFRMNPVGPGRYLLEVRRMGFLRRQVELKVDSAQLDTLRIELESFVNQCPDITLPAVRMEVRDAATGANVTRGARLEIVADGSTLVDQIAASDTSRDGPLVAGKGMPGTYRVLVSRPGYRSWTRENVQVRLGTCGLQTVLLRANLQKEKGATRVAESPKGG